MKRICLFLALWLAGAVAVWSAPALAAEYTVGIGDVLSIRVWGEESLSADVRVRPDGKISLPGAGDIQAEGATPVALQKVIASRLSSIVYEPMVTVMVNAANNNTVVVYGPGIRSAVIVLERKTTLLQLLAQVGPESGADLENATVTRKGSVVVKGFAELYRNGKDTNNIQLEPGDTLFVPLREQRHVYVTGAVQKPSTLPHYEGMTLLEAIHLAGGFTKFAARNDIRVVRKDAGGSQNINVRGGDLEDKGDVSQNIVLKGGDHIQVEKGWF